MPVRLFFSFYSIRFDEIRVNLKFKFKLFNEFLCSEHFRIFGDFYLLDPNHIFHAVRIQRSLIILIWIHITAFRPLYCTRGAGA